MRPEVDLEFITEGIHVLPVFTIDWGSGWYKCKIHIGWLFWFVEIEWPIE